MAATRKEPAPAVEEPGRYAYPGLDRVIHEKARLGVLAALAQHAEGLPFARLRALCQLTDGNLSRHLGLLAHEGLVEIQKAFVNNRPQTTCRMTAEGRKRLARYLQVLAEVVRDASAVQQPATARRTRAR